MMRVRSALVLVAAATLVMALAGCASNPTPTPTPSPTPTKLTVRGGDMGNYWENILVSRGTTKVDSATVTVNGTTIPMQNPGQYYGHLPTPLNEGDTVTLVVTDGSQKVQASAALPPKPTVTQPTGGQKIDATQPFTATWTLSSDPEKLVVYLNWPTNSASGTYLTVTPSSRSATIPANTIPKGAKPYLDVLAYTSGANDFTGDYASGSAMNLRMDVTVNFDTLP